MFETETSRWIAVQTRDLCADGKFVYCVKTTSIYCRPVCKARLARRANVIFHDDSKAAEADGFRPCMRCKPTLVRYAPQAEMISTACAMLQASASQGKEPTLRDLADGAGLTPSHFHRVFKSVMGVTPKLYAASLLGRGAAIAKVPHSRLGSLTPSYDHSSGTSEGSGTPYAAPTPVAVAHWQSLTTLENMEPSFGLVSNPICWQPQIEFTIQPWQSGYILIAASNNEVRAINVGDNCAELVATMRSRFPTADLLLSDWTATSPDEPSRSPNQVLFTSIMEALEKPTGKILRLPSNVFAVYA